MTQTGSRKRIKKFEVMVAKTVRETNDSTTLYLFAGNDALDYKPGHFITIDPHQFLALERWTAYLEDAKGAKEKSRAYSLFSTPDEKYLAITVKEEQYVSGQTLYPPLLSPVLVYRMTPGFKMVITGFTGPYTMPDDIEQMTDHVVHICAGSGVVPNMSMIKHALANDVKVRHTLIYSNRTWKDVIYRQFIEDLKRQYPERLNVVNALTRETNVDQAGAVSGRVNGQIIRQYVPDPSAAEFFVCGPGISKFDKLAAKEAGIEPKPRFLESVLDALDSMGVDKKKIHRESYG